ncbi:MAG: DNA cytosine methyltransferase [Turicibacter sp.]|nr:DNA cytosine methyltransferase [Turicibacter sp.]
MKVVDLFCGCGGFSLGFQNVGFEIIAACDSWQKAVDIYNSNFSHKADLLDLSQTESSHFNHLKADVIIGGPPCQDYSAAGKRDETEGRASLTLKFADIVCQARPKYFVMENVDRIAKSETLKQATSIFSKANYGLTKIVLDASKCGVPQKRKRFFLIGELNGSDSFLTNELLADLSTSTTVRDYFGTRLDTEYYYRHPRSYARRAIFSIDEPSPTIRGVNRPIPKNYTPHKGDATQNLSLVRPLTTLERAEIQTFPADFVFSGNKTELEQVIGNAVPVKLAEYAGKVLLKYEIGQKVGKT